LDLLGEKLVDAASLLLPLLNYGIGPSNLKNCIFLDLVPLVNIAYEEVGFSLLGFFFFLGDDFLFFILEYHIPNTLSQVGENQVSVDRTGE
jgi:hypothetical protein